MSLPAISPELALLIRASLGSDLNAAFQVSDKPIDWNRLGKLSKWHQVRPLLFDHLQNSAAPEKLTSELKAFSVGQAVANMAFAGISVRLHHALKERGISAFLMKGALWSWMLYEKGNLREFGDIDFFVARSDIRKSVEVFREFGFQPDAYRKYLLTDPRLGIDYFNTDYQLPLTPISEHTLQSLEVQWNCSYPRYLYNFEWQDLAADMSPFSLLGQEILVPRLEMQFIMMLVHHGGVEQWDKLKYVSDFVRFLRKFADQMDWPLVVNTTKQKGFSNILRHSLHLVKWLTGEDYSQYPQLGAISSYEYLSVTIGHWEKGRDVVQTKSLRILQYNLKYRDNWKFKVSLVTAHARYLSHWRLIWYKWKWYKS